MKTTKLSQEWKKLCRDLKPMTFTQRVDHIWTYYKEYMFVALMVLLLLIAAITMIGNLGRKTYLSGVLCNVSMTQEGHTYLVEGVRERHPEAGEGDVFLNSAIFENPLTVSQVDSSYQAAMAMFAQVEAEDLDYIFMDQVGMDFYAGQEVFLDVRTLLTEEEAAQWENKMAFVQFEDDEGNAEQDAVPLALDVTDLPFVRENIHSSGKVYLAFAGNLPRREATRQLWEDLLAWQGTGN